MKHVRNLKKHIQKVTLIYHKCIQYSSAVLSVEGQKWAWLIFAGCLKDDLSWA